MSPADVRLVAIRAVVERDWRQVTRHLARATATNPSRGDAEAALVALALDHAYQALENILLAVERALGLPERTGDRWHRALLADAVAALADVRPAIVPSESEADWAELLAFRHFLRHAYAVELDPERLTRLVTRLERAVKATEPSIDELLSMLEPGAESEH